MCSHVVGRAIRISWIHNRDILYRYAQDLGRNLGQNRIAALSQIYDAGKQTEGRVFIDLDKGRREFVDERLDPCIVGPQSHTHTPAVAATLFLGLSFFGPLNGLRTPCQTLGYAHTAESDLAYGIKVPQPSVVFQPDFYRINPQFFSNFIDHALRCKALLRGAEAAHCSSHGRVAIDTFALVPDIGGAVKHDPPMSRRQRDLATSGCIAPRIEGGFHLAGDESPVFLYAILEINDMSVAYSS